MLNGIIGKKLDQTQAFLENGRRIPLSMISVSGNVITQLKNPEKDHYTAAQIGFGDKKKTTKALQGHIKKAGLEKTPRFFREIRVDSLDGLEVGKELNVLEILEPGDVIDVTGTSKGKGYAGVVKKHHFKGGPRTHGQSDRERAPGSIGQTTTPGRVYKGKRMSGRMGAATVTVKNLTVIDIKDGIVYVKGLIPGVKGALVMISKAKDNKLSKALKKKYVPLFTEKIEEIAEPVVEEVVVEALPEEPTEAVADKQAEEQKTQEVETIDEKKEEMEVHGVDEAKIEKKVEEKEEKTEEKVAQEETK